MIWLYGARAPASLKGEKPQNMRKFMTLMLGLSLLTGAATISLAQEKKEESKKEGKKKGKKSKKEEKKEG